MYRVSEKVGLDDIEPGRQPRVHPIVRKGKVQVLDAPDYIQPILIHALPRPELSEHLGSVAVIRSVPENASPAPGHYWYVIVTVPGLGRRLRLWDATDWPWTEKMKATDWEAFISWWNAGVDAGWGTFSHLNEADLSLFFGDAPADTPPSVLARLKRTPALTAWLKEEPTSTSPTEVAKEKNA